MTDIKCNFSFVRYDFRERLNAPHNPASPLSGFENHYKIKLRASGQRLVYEVTDREVCVLVITVGKRDKGEASDQAQRRAGKQ